MTGNDPTFRRLIGALLDGDYTAAVAAVRELGVTGISPEMAVRLSIAFDTSAESWINQQTQYDLWHAEQGRKQLRVLRLAA